MTPNLCQAQRRALSVVLQRLHTSTSKPMMEAGRGRPGMVTDILALLGVNKLDHGPPQPRRDMFAEEDTRSFGVLRQPSEGTSTWSFHSVSALVRGAIGREPSGSEADQGDCEREKLDHLREGVQEALIRQGSLHSESSSHPTRRKEGSLWSYTDPFEDPLPDDEYDNLYSRSSLPEKDADCDNSVRSMMNLTTLNGPLWVPKIPFGRFLFGHIDNSLPSLQEPSRGQTSSSDADNTVHTPPASISLASCSPTASHFSDLHLSTTRHSILSSPTLSRSQSLSRPDSWWSRLTKPVLLDRRSSITSSKPVDFRDPAPAPPLATLEEARKSPAISGDALDIPVGHGRSVSSAHSGRTANTDSAEHLGGRYDVVQRLASDGSSSRRAPSLGSTEITGQGMLIADNHIPPEIPSSSSSSHVDPPQSPLSLASSATAIDPESPIQLATEPKSVPRSPTRGSMVASKVMEYECRMSQELESQQISPLRNTRRREEVPSQSRPTIRYGVVPRASLFIANPDLGHVS
ncbi:hypothetical protein JVU11DRAFT_4361 [Chiua virens]|nr:hypothetical protein JVU11DRAFT_4361 [Chiua virens]